MGDCRQREDANTLDRRVFLKRSGAALVAAAAAWPERAAADVSDPPGIRRKVTLGRTGLEMSDIGMGTGSLEDPTLVRHALARGITYFDTAESYPMKKPGLSERTLGEALAGRRNDVVITSKVIAGANVKRAQLMKRLERSLKRLRTDRIDIFMSHAVNDVERMRNPEWRAFIEMAKAQGKIRFSGMSGHGGRLAECLEYAIDHDAADVLLTAYNFGQDPAFYEKFTKDFDLIANQPELPRLLAKAKKKGIGTIAMKTLRGARLNDMRPYEWGGATYAQSAFRWVFSNENVDGLIVSMRTTEQIDEFVAASGQTKVGYQDMRLLRNYADKNDSAYCRPGCDACEASCPYGVSISDSLRARMYAVDYGDIEMAQASYDQLGDPAKLCASCTEAPCLAACPHDLPIRDLIRSVPRHLGRG